MPRYYFDIDDGRRARDDEGTQLASAELALAMAQDFARELALDEVRAGRSFANQVVVVRDANGEIAKVPLHLPSEASAAEYAHQNFNRTGLSSH